MANNEGRPLLNPVLALKREPASTGVQGMSAGEKGVRNDRLQAQRKKLSLSLETLATPASTRQHAGRVHFVATMFEDSFAPTWTPKWLFSPVNGARLVAPAQNGYLVEAEIAQLPKLKSAVLNGSSVGLRTAISRVEDIRLHNLVDAFLGRSAEELWNQAIQVDNERLFTLTLTPYWDNKARDSVVENLTQLAVSSILRVTFPSVSLTHDSSGEVTTLALDHDQKASSLERAARQYRAQRFARFSVYLKDRDSLTKLATSGAVYRIDPIKQVRGADVVVGADPDRPVPNVMSQPVVGVVDGGLTASSYIPMEAWRAPSLVSDVAADSQHGNRIASLVVHGHAWNPGLELPSLVCRIGTVQAIAKAGQDGKSSHAFTQYLREVIKSRSSECRVWNMSFNESDGIDPNNVSVLGHEISRIARDLSILPIISAGNCGKLSDASLAPPADCEAALVVSGRTTNDSGQLGDLCSLSRRGPGPVGMLKPDLSWYSHLRAIGGGAPKVGTSYSAAILSSLAAHTFHNLKSPTPDLVRALLINSADQGVHDHGLGWGSPQSGFLPWECAEGVVTLAWVGKLRAGYWYHWQDIPIPNQLIRNQKLFGKANLTAVLSPLVSELSGSNYFSSRLQVSLQYKNLSQRTASLLGSMKEDKKKELDARKELAKWHPIRHHSRDFTKGNGLTFSGTKFNLSARIFMRDLFQFDYEDHHEAPAQDVAFVLTLRSLDADSDIYNSMAASLGTYVESAVIDQGIELSNEAE